MLRRVLAIAWAFNVGITSANASPESERATQSCDAESFVREQRRERLALSHEESGLIAKAMDILKKRSEITSQRVELMQSRSSLGRIIVGNKYYTDRLDNLDNIYQSQLNDIEFQRRIIQEQIRVLNMQLSTFKLSCGY